MLQRLAVAVTAMMLTAAPVALAKTQDKKKPAPAAAQKKPENKDAKKADAKKDAKAEQDCDKKAEISDDEMKAYDENPLAAVMGKAKQMCTYAQTVAQKAKAAKGLPKGSNFADVNKDTAKAAVADTWNNSDDTGKVQVLGAVVTGGSWNVSEMSDAPGVPKARTVAVAHTMKFNGNCYVVYGNARQENGNHPDGTVPPSWGGTTYQFDDPHTAEKIDCGQASKL